MVRQQLMNVLYRSNVPIEMRAVVGPFLAFDMVMKMSCGKAGCGRSRRTVSSTQQIGIEWKGDGNQCLSIKQS